MILVTTVAVKGYLGEDFCYGTGVWCGIKSNLDPEIITTWMYIVDIAWQITCYISTCFLYIFLIFVVRFCGVLRKRELIYQMRELFFMKSRKILSKARLKCGFLISYFCRFCVVACHSVMNIIALKAQVKAEPIA